MHNVYKNLDLASRPAAEGPYIRLLNLTAGSQHDSLECRLAIYSLQSLPEYRALSYCWGDAREKRNIQCNDQAFEVATSLYSCLLDLRQPEENLTLWVDAICINQLDLAEREQQVEIMREIYSVAKEVLVWLGRGDNKTNLAMAACQQIMDSLQLYWLYSGFNFDALGLGNPWAGFQARPLSDTELKGLTDIMQRPWWDRVWVVQEVSLAREAKIIVGRSVVEWHQFTVVMHFLRLQNHSVSGLESQSHVAIGKMKEEQTQGLRSLGQLLSTFRWARATDSRDKVYGLLGLSSNPGLLRPDYTASIEQCYIQAAFSIIKDTGSLDILEHCTTPSFVRKRKLPSWVQDWSYDAQSLPKRYLITETSLYLKAYQARMHISGTSGPSFNASCSSYCTPLLEDGKTLVVDGILIDTIKDLQLPILLSHMAMNPCSGRGFAVPNPSASHEEHKAAMKKAEWLVFTSPTLLFLSLNNNYRVGKLLAILLSSWDMVHPQRNGTELAALEDLLTALTNSLLAKEMISALAKDLAKYRIKFEGGDVRLRICHRLRLRSWLPLIYFLVLGHVGLGLGMGFMFGITHIMMFGVDSRIGMTAGGRIARVPWDSQKGDRIVLLRGGKTPFVVRRARGGERWRLVGAANVKGMMAGELWSEEKCYKIEIR